jgi:peptidyl-prolyl cis-trans isomerase A (cyclophilin A)
MLVSCVMRGIEEVIAMKMFRTLFVLAAVAALAVSVASAQAPAAAKPSLKSPASLKEQAPEVFKAAFDTSAGAFVVEVHRAWAPKGADRFYNLVKNGFFDNCRFFRVVSGFMVQFGINGDPAIQGAWRNANITDDPAKESNKKGYITFANAGPNSRTTQVFINYADNAFLDSQGFPPFGKVVTGMDVVQKLYAGYGEGAPQGKGPSQGQIQTQGNAYLEKDFPKLDFVKKATIAQ